IEGYILSQVFDSFAITDISSDSELVTVKYEPLTAEASPREDTKSGFRIRGTVQPPEKAGDISATITVKTDLEEFPEFKFVVKGQKLGPMSIVGPGWYADHALFQLGKVIAEKGHKGRYTLFVDDFGQDLEVTKADCTPDFLKVTLAKLPSAEGATRQRYLLEIDVPAGSPKSVWIDDHKGEIRLTTNHPELATLTFKVTMDVQ
ncbi:MAG: hypothetical protein KDA58_15980, partial [Planctomycetaceae bacterium]|nr:hypothetical protein [Planctomycetaceae bacterium]